MRFDNPFEVVRTLDDAALRVLLVLLFMRKQGMAAPGEDELQTYTGKTQNTVRKGLAQLGLYNLVQRNAGRYWVLTSEVVQLPLMVMLLEGAAGAVDNLYESVDKCAAFPSQNLTLPGTTTTYLHSRESGASEEAVVSKGIRESKFDSRVNRNLAILHHVGIVGKVAAELAQLDYVTPEYVGALAGTLRESDTVGLLVRKIRDHDPMPVIRHAPGCDCSECRRRYVTGEFADYIEH